jgi:decaprenyl-phosphate phosphoribosyltransferase
MAWIQLMRLHQWPKNFFVFAGLVFARLAGDPQALILSLKAFFFFCMASSLVYIFNDLMDQESDARHPRKHKRPLASQEISRQEAIWALGLLLPLFTLALLLTAPVLWPIFLLYFIMNAAYSLGLKQIPLLDILIITAGFLLRIYAGTKILAVPLSGWALLCTASLAIFISAAKRRMELPQQGKNESITLRGYAPKTLDRTLLASALWTGLSYTLYALQPSTTPPGSPSMLWTLPFVILSILHYKRRVFQNLATGRSLILDRTLFLILLLWILSSLWILH